MKMLVAPSSGQVVQAPGAEAFERLPVLPRWKRVLDIVCCVAAMPVFVGCTLVVALLTRLSSPGPIFYHQERVGFQGRRFKLYKFRTMHVRADTGQHQMHFAELVRSNLPMRKLDGQGDSRLMTGGRLLRAAGLDELPQIVNVLRGEMSVVGPRPCIPYEYPQFSIAHRERFEVAPGITGLWQVSGKNGTTFDEMIELDTRYVRSRSLAADLKIICRTIPALCGQLAEARVQSAAGAPEAAPRGRGVN
jgi:exopolysaccharide production protein ExoY